jgi:hypothetical protein
MSLNIVPFEQAAAEMITGLLITGGQKGNAGSIVKRANTALAVADAFTAINSGDPTGVVALQSALGNSNLDPGVNLGLQSLLAIGTQQLAGLSGLNKGLPLIGATATAIAANILTGITAAANAEIAKYAAAVTAAPAPAAAA